MLHVTRTAIILFFDGNEEMGGSIPSHATDTDFRIKTEHGEMAER